MDDLGGIGVAAPVTSSDSETDGSFSNIADDGTETAADTWKFWRIGTVGGTIGRIRIMNKDASAHLIHGAFLRVS